MVQRRLIQACVLLLGSYFLKPVLSGVEAGGGSDKLSVIISYETDIQEVTDFFTKQLNANVFEEFSKCNVIRWNFMPCETSSMVQGALACRKKEPQCSYDKINACAATLYQHDQQQVGKFVICFNTSNDGKKCACDNGMNWEDIEKCVKRKDGDRYCNTFFDRIINDWQTYYIPGIKFGSKYDQNLNKRAIDDFKGVLCAQLKSNNLQCSVCSCN